ncbi:hypothetical protein [Saccharopolyspora griseoalba]|uniref:DUF3040 domain-containing protein n=1 Tax=Saccharopolyspora griseoalba TaxID=1431848 RepID=A0ABW2LE50_9PSEU
MAKRAAQPVTAGLSRLAQLDRGEREELIAQLCRQYPAFRSMIKQVSIARGVAFGSGLVLAASVVCLAQGASAWLVAALVFGGLAGFGWVAVALTDSRFDLLMAVLGAHRTDELHGRLLTEQIYGEELDQVDERSPVVRSRAVGSRITGEPSSAR